MEIELTAYYSVLDLKTKCLPLCKSVVCIRGQALSLKVKKESSILLSFRVFSSSVHGLMQLLRDLRSALFSVPANNKAKHCDNFFVTASPSQKSCACWQR
ncbi:hypothetical protein, partial [Gilvimarinus polysaccharolyticus]|uniref:hypothetical protein n=1 Tax=Gilvimarinus polysaccharolyticus TaxID=863921 RepID=UPI001E2ECAF7